MSIPLPQLPNNNALYNFPSITKQQGSSLVLALFVIIILTLLGSILMRMISTSSETVSQEVIGTRAYMAANSAMQAELQLLFPLNGSETCPLAPLAASVRTHDFSTSGMNIDGLYDCTAEVSCSWYATHPITDERFYRLTSTGECGAGTIEPGSKAVVISSRSIQVEARSL
jgi:MSHA biogenesis protein MshP